MYKSKLIRLYQTLDAAELRQFKKWVKSPIHNRHKDVQQLFEYLFTKAQVTEENADRHKVFAVLYPNKPLNMARLRHVMSFATDVLEEFIRYKEYTTDDQNAEMLLLKGFRKRRLLKEAQRQEQTIRQRLEEQVIQDEAYYWQKHQLEIEQFRVHTEGDVSSSRSRASNTNLQAVLDSSSLFFVFSSLRYACICITHQNLYKTKYEVPFLEAILSEISSGAYADVPSIQLYYASYLALTSPNKDSSYELLKTAITNYPSTLPQEEYREVYGIAINYCIKRSNTGNRYYAEEAFSLYLSGIEQGILLTNGYLSPFAYKNTVGIGLFLGHTDTIKEFLPKGNYLLHPKYRENYIHYSTAKFHFATENYSEAQSMLFTMDYDDLFMTVDAKMMLLKIYVVQEDFEVLESYIHSFTQFLRRKSELSYHRQSFLNTLRFTQKVVHAFTKEEKESLAKTIEATPSLPEKRWLLEQLANKS